MNVVTMPDAERVALAARLGLPVDRIPTQRTIIPRGVSAFDPGGGVTCWRDKAARQQHAQRLAHQRRMAALKEREAANNAPDQRDVAANIRRQQQEACDARWLNLVNGGMSRAAACVAIGYSEQSQSRIVKRLEARGLCVAKRPRVPRPRAKAAPTPDAIIARDDRWLAMVRGGMTQENAMAALDLPRGAIKATRRRLMARGITIPRMDASKVRAAGSEALRLLRRNSVAGRDMEWLALVNGGMTFAGAAESLGINPRSCSNIAGRLRAQGHVVLSQRTRGK